VSRTARAGRSAEARASRHLQRAGLTLRHENYRCRAGELDLVMETPGGEIVFVEVRYRSREDYGGALASVDARKQQRLIRAARLYLAAQRLDERPARFDVVAVDGYDRIRWVEAAFDASAPG